MAGSTGNWGRPSLGGNEDSLKRRILREANGCGHNKAEKGKNENCRRENLLLNNNWRKERGHSCNRKAMRGGN